MLLGCRAHGCFGNSETVGWNTLRAQLRGLSILLAAGIVIQLRDGLERVQCYQDWARASVYVISSESRGDVVKDCRPAAEENVGSRGSPLGCNLAQARTHANGACCPCHLSLGDQPRSSQHRAEAGLQTSETSCTCASSLPLHLKKNSASP